MKIPPNAMPKTPCYEIYCLNYHSEDYVVYRNNAVTHTGDLDSCISYVQAAKSGAPKAKPPLAKELLHGLFVTPSIIMLLTWFVHYITAMPEGLQAGLMSYLIATVSFALFKAIMDFAD